MCVCVCPGVPEGAGQEDQQHPGPEALGPRADGHRPRRHGLGQGPAAGAQQPLGYGVRAVRQQADPPPAGRQTGQWSTLTASP